MPTNRDPFNSYSSFYDLYQDQEDYFEEFSGGGHILEFSEDALGSETLCDPFIYQSLEEIVMASLLSIKDFEVRRKFASSILVIGGGAHMSKLAEEIVIKLNLKFEGMG